MDISGRALWIVALALCNQAMTYAVAMDTSMMSFGVVMDAGSSGTRVRLYRWSPRISGDRLPEFEEFFNKKKEPGISIFKDGHLDEMESYLEPLIEAAKQQIPENKHNTTSIYLMATAGMRLLMAHRATIILDSIRKIFSRKELCPFRFSYFQARILSGEEEGVFAWIAANYLNHYFDDPVGKDSHGIMELGGASAQIAFVPKVSVLADKFPVRLAGRLYPLYVHSYLYYGQTFADLWVKEYLHRQNTDNSTLMNPCMLPGDTSVKNISNLTVTFHGSGEPLECSRIVEKLVFKVESYHCYPKPCAIGQVYQPSISESKRFFALSAFIYPLRTLDVLDEDGVFSPAQTYEAALEYCQKDIETVMNETGRTSDYLSEECLMGIYIPMLLTRGFGFDNDTRQVAAKLYINGQPAEWTLGALIYESERQSVTWCPRTEMVTSLAGSARMENAMLTFNLLTLFTSSLILNGICHS